jgi:hypothetical protein
MARTLHEALARQREDELLRQVAQECLGGSERDRPARPVLHRLLARRHQSSSPAVQATAVVECTDQC